MDYLQPNLKPYPAFCTDYCFSPLYLNYPKPGALPTSTEMIPAQFYFPSVVNQSAATPTTANSDRPRATGANEISTEGYNQQVAHIPPTPIFTEYPFVGGPYHFYQQAATNHRQSLSKYGKRRRVTFSRFQISEMENLFHKQQYLNADEREDIAKRINLSQNQVKIWFQNRRYKLKTKLNSIGK